VEPSRVGKTFKIGEAQLGERDAFHVPCILARSLYTVQGGQSVLFTDEQLRQADPSMANLDNRHGIVDPFIKIANPGEMFWVLLNPNLVTKLNHQFEVNLEIDELEPEYDECSGCYGSPSYDENDDEYEDNSCRGCY
jgi:hypothetical protein